MIIREFKRPDIKRVLEIETEAFKDNLILQVFSLIYTT